MPKRIKRLQKLDTGNGSDAFFISFSLSFIFFRASILYNSKGDWLWGSLPIIPSESFSIMNVFFVICLLFICIQFVLILVNVRDNWTLINEVNSQVFRNNLLKAIGNATTKRVKVEPFLDLIKGDVSLLKVIEEKDSDNKLQSIIISPHDLKTRFKQIKMFKITCKVHGAHGTVHAYIKSSIEEI